MNHSNKNGVLRYDQRVVAAKKIEKVLAGQHPSIKEITGRIRHLAESPLTVVVLGEFSAGKSSFLNRLLATDALPVAILPKTATLTRLVHAGQDEVGKVEIDRRGALDIETDVVDYHAFAELQRAAKIHDINVSQDLERIQEVRVFLEDPLLTKLQLVDTPGFNHDQAMDERTLGILESADIVFWITDAIQPAKQTEFEKLNLLKASGKRMWLIVNKADINVTDLATWEESRNSLESYFKEIGFLDFFESKTLELVSCRESGEFWDGKFEQTKARLGAEIFNLDIHWSHRLIGDEWERLKSTLEDETIRYQELERHSEAMQLLTQAQDRAAQSQEELYLFLREQLVNLHGALQEHAHIGQDAAKLRLAAVTAFFLEYTRAPLVEKFQELTGAYYKFLHAWHTRHLNELIHILDVLQDTLPQTHVALRAKVTTLRDYKRLLHEELAGPNHDSSWQGLPALEQTIELLDHLSVMQHWPVRLTIDADKALDAGLPGTLMKSSMFCEGQLSAALELDFQTDIKRLICDPAILALLAELKALCSGASDRQTDALTIWRNHAACPEFD
ncbi:dynamin family protein [Desulfuromonas thiophila]|uniref:dynamin family protein n=1 Tax=Desulfuromonas thiophila TaxID=57664 RepID=UPI0024A9FD41|nr:dynamin family protein [Desulfuromonas thiophila]